MSPSTNSVPLYTAAATWESELVRMYAASSEVGNGTTTTLINTRRFKKSNGRSTRTMW